MSHFLKECKKVLLSVTYLVLVITIVLFAYSQDVLTFTTTMEAPQPNQQGYGTRIEEDPAIIMPAATQSLWREFTVNSYTTYPIGFYKHVKLNDSKVELMAGILSGITGVSETDLLSAVDKGTGDPAAEIEWAMPHPLLNYEEFQAYMLEADDLLGGGSDYAVSTLTSYGKVPLSYEEALADYQLMRDSDRYTGAHARLFADYLNCMLSLLPVFVAIALGLRDRRSRMHPLIDSRSVSSVKLIGTRYLAMITMIMLPVCMLSFISNVSVWGDYNGEQLDYLAFMKYALGWLLPTVMITTSVGMFLTELTRTPVAIAVQLVWWLVDMNKGIRQYTSGYDLLLLNPRHNSLGQTQNYVDQFQSLLYNRLSFTVIALLLVALTMVIYEERRRGRWSGTGRIKTMLANRRHKSAA